MRLRICDIDSVVIVSWYRTDVIMSFLNIKNPAEREAVVKDYTALVKRIQQGYEDEKLGDLTRQRDLEEQWRPVVKSQNKVVEKVSKALEPIRQGVLSIRQSLERPRKMEFENLGHEAEGFITRNKIHDPTLDTTFGIRFSSDGRTFIGNTPITIQGDDIIINNEVYHGTRGLWSLITDTQKDQITNAEPTKNDKEEYASMLYQTNVLHEDSNPDNKMPRSNRSWKWRQFLGPIWETFKKMDDSSDGGGLIIPGCLLYLKKNGHCCQVRKMGKGLYLEPHHSDLQVEDGLYIETPSSNLYDGQGIQSKLHLLNILK